MLWRLRIIPHHFFWVFPHIPFVSELWGQSKDRICPHPGFKPRPHIWWVVSILIPAPLVWIKWWYTVVTYSDYLSSFCCVIDFDEVSRRVKALMSAATITHNLPIAEALVNTKPKGWVLTGAPLALRNIWAFDCSSRYHMKHIEQVGCIWIISRWLALGI